MFVGVRVSTRKSGKDHRHDPQHDTHGTSAKHHREVPPRDTHSAAAAADSVHVRRRRAQRLSKGDRLTDLPRWRRLLRVGAAASDEAKANAFATLISSNRQPRSDTPLLLNSSS